MMPSFLRDGGAQDRPAGSIRARLEDIQTLNERRAAGTNSTSRPSNSRLCLRSDRMRSSPAERAWATATADAGRDRRKRARAPARLTSCAIGLRWPSESSAGKNTIAYLALQLFLASSAPGLPFVRFFETVKTGRAATAHHSRSHLTSTPAAVSRSCSISRWWKEKTGLPLPLGGNVPAEDLAPELRAPVPIIAKASTTGFRSSRGSGAAIRCHYARTMDRCSVQIHRHVFQRFHARLRRDWTQAIRECSPRRERAWLWPATGEIEFVD